MRSPFAHLEPTVRYYYERAAPLVWEGARLGFDSSEGAQQGDVLGPFLFALAFHPTLRQAASEFPDCVFVAYHGLWV